MRLTIWAGIKYRLKMRFYSDIQHTDVVRFEYDGVWYPGCFRAKPPAELQSVYGAYFLFSLSAA